MDSKPVITYAGDEKLFESLKNGLAEGLPQESVEWRRSHVRNPKPVYVTANFRRFSEETLPKDNGKSLLGQSFFHAYWTNCSDLDAYKQTVKDEINTWLATLKVKKIYDWLIIVVDQVDSKKTSKTKLLPRTTVIDKIKNDFPSQNAQRCISVMHPGRNDSRSHESWQFLLQRIRKLVLQAYSRQLSQFEEHMRTQRERRNEQGWNFHDFFFLQEELAFVLEMLGLYDEALVQYDELDALFTQFVINSNVGEMPDWLSNYSRSCDLWSGLCLLRERSVALREVLQKGEACLLDLRNYLFARQCALLLLLCRPWEVAQRTLPFLHNCIAELRILEISMPVGSVGCWVFLSCLEVLQTCERFSDTSQIKAYSLYTAGLWAYAREKLHGLGLLCGLMPDQTATSEQLHLVVSLLSGLGNDPYQESNDASPHIKLREALSSKESFLKHYLELSELTMGTFKHNRRIRTARLIGRDLAQLYRKMKQPQKAASFLTDLLKTYKEENWQELLVQTQKDLFECYQEMDDAPKYLKISLRLASTLILPLEERQRYFEEVINGSSKLDSDILHLMTEKIFHIDYGGIESSDIPIVSNSDIRISFQIRSALPQEIICRYIKVLLKQEAPQTSEKVKSGPPTSQSRLSANQGSTLAHSPISPMQSGGLGIPSREDMPPHVVNQPHLVTSSYQVNGVLTYALICKNCDQIIRRRDSQCFTKEKSISDEEIGINFKEADVKILPGANVIILSIKIPEPGIYVFSRLWMEWGNIHFIFSHLSTPFNLTVIEEPPSLSLKSEKGDLLAGFEQELVLSVSSGSSLLPHDTKITLKTTKNLQLKDFETGKDWLDVMQLSLPQVKPFQTVTLPLKVIARFCPQKSTDSIDHGILVQCSWMQSPFSVSLSFLPPFLFTHKLHSCGVRKYIQITAHSMASKQFLFNNFELRASEASDATLKLLNSSGIINVCTEQAASFLWEIIQEESETFPTKFIFCTDYSLNNKKDEEDTYKYEYDFKLNNFETLYAVRARVEPPKGSEFCRAGIMCYMHISINQLMQSIHTSLMYEVVADQSMWAVCGRTAGVVNIDSAGKHSVILDVMPLTGGFLPLPTVRLSKYIPAEQHKSNKDSTPSKESTHSVARLEPFDPGQVYSWSRAMQVHVLPGSNTSLLENPS